MIQREKEKIDYEKKKDAKAKENNNDAPVAVIEDEVEEIDGEAADEEIKKNQYRYML
jgi:hypothetical protein